MSTIFTSQVLQRFEQASQYEWLETNGLGGYASASIIGTHTRRYHGLLVAAINPPVERKVLISRLEPTVVTEENRYELAANKYQGAIYPHGYIFQEKFERDLFPVFSYQVGEIQMTQTIAAIHGENTTVILYEVQEADAPFQLELMPLLAGRDFHALQHAGHMQDPQARWEENHLHLWEQNKELQCMISIPGAEYEAHQNWYFNYEYEVELHRGMEAHEDLFTPGVFRVSLQKGQKLGIVLSTSRAGRDAFGLVEQEKLRRKGLLAKANLQPEAIRRAILAADQFIVRRGNDQTSIIAGYPWFTDWGRDTMIALPGLCLATGRFEDARKILNAFASHVAHGLLPNRFPDEGEEPEYNTIDATLWFFIAAWKYLEATQDEDFLKEVLLPVFGEIMQAHKAGTKYNIRLEEDGLLAGGEEGVQLTWMDAKVDDWVVTPRQGKAVEINALWYNSCKIYAKLLAKAGRHQEAENWEGFSCKVKASFLNTFVVEGQNHLIDVVTGEQQDCSIRPNQLFAISLPFPLLNVETAGRVLASVEEHLLTPRGLRSLSHTDLSYRGFYGGDVYKRDGAYHQGTVWSWLIGPYLDAVLYVRGTWGKDQAKEVLTHYLDHLNEACIGSISEIFDGDAPYLSRGCFAQAWGVSEALRIQAEHQLLEVPKRNVLMKKRKSLLDHIMMAGFL